MSLRPALLCLATAIAACGDDTTQATAPAAPTPQPPSISAVVVSANPNSAISFTVAVTTDRADSIRIRYESADDTSQATPFYRVASHAATAVVVVGLRASTTYTLVAEAIGQGGRVVSTSQSAATGELPPALQTLHLTGSGSPSAGYTLVAPLFADTSMTADGFLVAFDQLGVIRWYHRFPGAWPVEAKQQPNGHITVYVGRSYGWQPTTGAYVELTAGGEVARSFAVANGYFTDPHELLLSFRDTVVTAAHLIGYDVQTFDLTSVGGPPHARLAVHTIERHDAAGALTFRWSAGSLFSIGDWPLPNPNAADLEHPSSLAVDSDGGYVVSFQGMDEVTKIDSTTGALVWRLGGRHNQFAIRDDPLNGFRGQHDVQVLANGDLLMLDDHFRGVPAPARAVEYALDTRNMVARMVWQYQPSPPVISPIMGSAQRLADGSTLVGFGAAGQVDEVGSDGTVRWSASLRFDAAASAVPFYRAIRLRSLYEAKSP
ncbi:MAG TPA: arylsulfotransferase family protein [Gemmatimonadaceae bacterium]|nr:arylsulfotransferase family protein [Gemmatimonadaceae bacterium]